MSQGLGEFPPPVLPSQAMDPTAEGSPSRDEADAQRYQAEPVPAGEFESIEDPLAWDADGWDGF